MNLHASQFIPFSRSAAMKIVSRRMPGAHRFGSAAYKTDGTTLEELNDRVKEFVEQNKGLVKEASDAKAEVIRITKEHSDKVAELNVKLTEKDATLGQIKSQVDEMRAKMATRAFGVIGEGADNQVKSFQGLIEASIEKNAAQIAVCDQVKSHSWDTEAIGKQARVKAAGTISIANSVGSVSISGIPTIDQNIATRGHEEMHFRDIFPVFDSATGSYIFYRANTPTGDGSITKQTTHGAAKSQKDYDLTPIKVDADYLAGFVDIARQALTDVPMLQSYVGNELIEDYLDQETFNMWNELVNQSTGPTVATGANPMETMIKSIAAMRQIKRRVNLIAGRPGLWSQLLLTKPNDYNLPVNSVSITPSGTVSIVGVPFYTTATNALSDTKFVIGDTRQAGIMQVTGEGLKLQVFTQHDKAVYNNIQTMRVEARVALLQRRLEAFSYQTA
jgi:hypothetical protein